MLDRERERLDVIDKGSGFVCRCQKACKRFGIVFSLFQHLARPDQRALERGCDFGPFFEHFGDKGEDLIQSLSANGNDDHAGDEFKHLR